MRYPPQRQPYPANVTLLSVKNAAAAPFSAALMKIPHGAYEVEQIADGRSICIVKPGGKAADGYLHDFEVFICDAQKSEAWRISHTALKNDIVRKLADNHAEGERIIIALRQVCAGAEPDVVLSANTRLGANPSGLSAEVLLKVYKWIWGQEDCNYPPPYEGRGRSWASIEDCLA